LSFAYIGLYLEKTQEYKMLFYYLPVTSVIKIHTNIEYYDFMSDARFVNDDFRDADHLNGVGARKLTEIIDYIINYGKRLVPQWKLF